MQGESIMFGRWAKGTQVCGRACLADTLPLECARSVTKLSAPLSQTCSLRADGRTRSAPTISATNLLPFDLLTFSLIPVVIYAIFNKVFFRKQGIIMYDELTKQDIAKIQEEIDHRKLVVRHEALEALKEARAQGDLSENFEYYAAKRDKNKNESRIRYLEKMIRTAKVIEDDSAEDEVGLFNTVTIYIEDDDEEETYKLVTTVRGNSMQGRISIDSPLGKAILGHKVGERVYVKVNDRVGYYCEIRHIEKTVDDGSDELRGF